MLEKVKNGTHKGWQSRNITSYPEKFFISVLKNNNLFDYNNADNVKILRRYKYPIDYIRSTRR